MKKFVHSTFKHIRRNFCSTVRTEAPVRKVTICYGSQTGTAEGFAHELQEALSSKHITANVVDLADVNPASLMTSNAKTDDEVTAFVVSCYGVGEPTDNARNFYSWLMSEEANKLDPQVSRNFKFTVFGLGNSRSFPERYQAVGRTIESRLAHDLGAIKVFKRGEGDDSGTIEHDFDLWKTELLDCIEKDTVSMPKRIQQAAPVPPKPTIQKKKFNITLLQPSATSVKPREHLRETNLAESIKPSNPLYCPIVNAVNLCPDSPRLKRMLEFDIANNMKYEAGDHVGIYAQNDPTIVQRFAQRLNLDLNTIVTITSNVSDISPPFVSSLDNPVLLGTAISEFYDLNGAITPSFLKVLTEYAKNESEQQLLSQLTASSSAKYNSIIKDPMLNIVDILYMFPSIDIPIDILLPILPRIQPRYYSISSSPKVHPKRMQITFGTHVVAHGSRSIPFKGLCSHYLGRLGVGDRAAMFTRTSNFRLPTDPRKPIICVAGGTGIAPFMGFIEERMVELQSGATPSQYGESLLFYGVRDPSEFMYKSDIEQAMSKGIFSKLFVSFSATDHKMISDTLDEQHKLVWKLLQEGANLYFCGGIAGFGESLYASVKKIALRNGIKSGDDFVAQLRKEGRCFEDLAD